MSFLSKCSLVISFLCRLQGFDSITDSFGRGREPITSKASGARRHPQATAALLKFQIVFHHWGSSWAPAGKVSHSWDDSSKWVTCSWAGQNLPCKWAASTGLFFNVFRFFFFSRRVFIFSICREKRPPAFLANFLLLRRRQHGATRCNRVMSQSDLWHCVSAKGISAF